MRKPSSRARNSEAAILSSSHSQIVLTLQPSRRSLRSFAMSRALLPSSFGSQNRLLLCGILPFRQRCACQKQPLTCKAVEYFGSTMSGQPGRLRTWRRNRKPIAWSARRTVTSGRVSLDRDAGHDCRPLLRRDPVCQGDFLLDLPIGIGATGMMDDSIGQRSHSAQSWH